MKTFPLHPPDYECPHECKYDCRAVECPVCYLHSWIDQWEVYDDRAICPHGCVTTGYLATTHNLCRGEVAIEVAREEAEEAARPKRRRKPQETTLFE